jgi:HK97 family phage prohead protease
MEKRYRSFDVALRTEPESDKPTKIVGYAAVFDSPSVDLGGFDEIIRPGAFSDALADPALDVVCTVDHDWARLLGRSTSGTLRLSQDDHGLAIECDLPDTQLGRDIAVLMQRGDISQMSFCFTPIDERISDDGRTREVLSCNLHDVSIVLYPAYPSTEAELRNRPNTASKRRQLLVRTKLFVLSA